MAKREELKTVPCKVQGKTIPQIPRLVMLRKEVAPAYQNWSHEIARGDCYVALHKTGRLVGYRSKWSSEEHKEFAKGHGVYFDSQFELEGSPLTFFLEVDMGTEYWKDELNEKVEEYASLAQSMPQTPFYVLFLAKAKNEVPTAARLKAFGDCFRQYGRGQKFVVTDLELFTADPLAPLFAAQGFPAPKSLLELL
jgi:hypothetical protein